MIITLTMASNGVALVVEYGPDNEDKKELLVFNTEDGGRQEVANLLGTILDLIGESGSRYDKERVYITVEPGDKYEQGEDDNG